jgi:hypothetical protein
MGNDEEQTWVLRGGDYLVKITGYYDTQYIQVRQLTFHTNSGDSRTFTAGKEFDYWKSQGKLVSFGLADPRGIVSLADIPQGKILTYPFGCNM